MASAAILMWLAYFVRISDGLGPAYTYIQTDLDQLAAKMKVRDEGYRNVFKKFDAKLNTLNSSLSADTIRIYTSLTSLESELLRGQNNSLSVLNGIGNLTAEQFEDLKDEITTMQQDTTRVKDQLVRGRGDTGKILEAVSGVRGDYEEFKTKTALLWNLEANVSSIRTQLEENREHMDSEISNLRREISNVVKEEMVAVQTALASLLNDMSELKNGVKTKDSRPACPSTWRRFENSCYKLITEPTTWKLAKFICSQMDSFLIEMYSDEEVNYAAELAGNDTGGVWTGASVRQRVEWSWSESRSEVKFDLFSGNYPTGRNRAYCAFFVPGDRSLRDSRCGRQNPYICRKIAFRG